MAFEGWSDEALRFYEDLGREGTRAWWHDHKHVYETAVRAPMEALAAEVAEAYGPLHIFRPYRDVRFSKDKTPYKDHIGAVTEGPGGEVFYVHLSAEGLMAATGYHQMARDQLERYYAAVDDETTGEELRGIVDALRADHEVGGSVLKTAPRGYPRDHPRVELLRHKGVTIARRHAPGPWLGTPAALDHVRAVWDAGAPLNAWLARSVGPSTLPPPGRP